MPPNKPSSPNTNEILYAMMDEWAQEHSEANDEFIMPIEHDEHDYPEKLLYHSTGEAQAHQITDIVLDSIAAAPIELWRHQMQEAEQVNGWIDATRELLKGGNNVVLVTNHADLPDIAYAHALLYGEIGRQNDAEGHDKDFSTGLIISEMIQFLKFQIDNKYISALEAVHLLEDNVYLSYPRSKSVDNLIESHLGSMVMRKAAQTYIKTHNIRMRNAVGNQLKGGSAFIAVAASGTTDKLVDGVMQMGTVGIGTLKLISGERPLKPDTETYVLPVSIYHSKSEEAQDGTLPFAELSNTPVAHFRVVSHPKFVESDDDIHAAMGAIAEDLTGSVSGREFIYKTF